MGFTGFIGFMKCWVCGGSFAIRFAGGLKSWTTFEEETIRQTGLGLANFAACFGDIGTLHAVRDKSPGGRLRGRWSASRW